LALPGIGRYTAGAISSIAFNEPRPILDGNVIRVLTRLFGIGGNPREKGVNEQLWQLAEKLVAKASALAEGSSCSHFNQSLMELGALICTPRQPNCSICPVQKQCDAFRSRRVGELPNLGPRVAATVRRFVAFVVEHRGLFLVRQRPAGVVNAHLWEFPNVEITAPFADPQKIAGSDLGFKVTDLEKLCVIKHSITRYRITLEAWRIKMKRHPKKLLLKGCWLAPCDLQTLAFSSAHKQVLEQACQAAPKDYVASIITARPALKPVGRHIRFQQQK
jgi:A/G-specific adenine glycosylase